MIFRLTTLIFILYLLSQLLLFLVLPTRPLIEFSQLFNNFSVGLGALFAGLGGLGVLNEYAEKLKLARKIREWKIRYHPKNFRKTFKLIKSSVNPNWIYIHDLESNLKHHIGSRLTFDDFGFTMDMVDQLGTNVFNDIKEGETILTKGEVGT